MVHIKFIIKTIKNNSYVYIRMEGKGRRFRVHRGVKQGDPLSPNLFNSILEEIFRILNWEREILIDGKRLNNLGFADDLSNSRRGKKCIENVG